MPRFDKTGPEGQGPITGRGKGNCRNQNENNQYPKEDHTERGLMGKGRGRRKGKGLFGFGKNKQ